MPRKKNRLFTDVEFEFMQVLWYLGEATPDDISRDLSKKGRNISIGSIRNVLSIMMNKGFVARRKRGKAFLYQALILRDEARKTMIRNLLMNAFDGSESLVVASLLENPGISSEELEAIKRLINDHEEGKR